jgi:hypothetical protein
MLEYEYVESWGGEGIYDNCSIDAALVKLEMSTKSHFIEIDKVRVVCGTSEISTFVAFLNSCQLLFLMESDRRKYCQAMSLPQTSTSRGRIYSCGGPGAVKM